MVTYQSRIIYDFRELLLREKLLDVLPKDDVKRLYYILELELIKKYNSIHTFINLKNHQGYDREYIKYIINCNEYKIRLVVYNTGAYEIHFAYNKSISGKYDKTYLLNEFRRDVGYVYFIKSAYGYKIGKAKNIKNRLKIFEVKLPFEFELKHYIKTIDYNELEVEIHDYFKDSIINGEWFQLEESDIEELRIYLKSKNYRITNEQKNKT